MENGRETDSFLPVDEVISFLDTKGVVFAQQMYNGKHENTYVVQTCPKAQQESSMKYVFQSFPGHNRSVRR